MSAMPESTLGYPQQIIAELQQQLVECRAERDEALQRETATAEVLQVINSSPGDLGPVFEAMLDKAMRLCEADVGNFWTYDGEAFTAVAMRDPRPEHLEWARQRRRGGPGSISDSLIRGESVIHIPDAADTDAYRAGEPARRAIVDLSGGRTLLAVALRKADELLGYITIFRRVVRPFTDKQIALLQNFAAEAVIAMENARLLTETREALDQQTATAEVLQVINLSPGDLAPVFDAMLEKAMRFCEAVFGVLLTYDGDRFHHAALRGVPAAYTQYMREHPPIYGPETAPGRLASGERLVHVVDITDTDTYRLGDRNRRAIADLAGARTLVAVPLCEDAQLLGAIVIYRQEVRPFSDKQIALLQTFAAQAIIAMENARLLTETREALQQQTATAEVLGVINSSPGDLAPVFDAILEKATRLCEAPFGHLRTWDGECFHLGAAHGDPRFRDWFRQRGPIRSDRFDGASPLGRIIAGERVVSFVDVRGDERYRTSHPGFKEMAEASGVRSAIWVALHKDDALLGTITVYRQEVRPFTDRQIALLQNFAAQAVIAMENARLITETREALEQQTATAEVLGVINSSPGDLAPVFNAMLDKAMRLSEAAHGTLTTYDGEYFRAAAVREMPEPLADLLRQPFLPSEGGSQEALLQGDRLVHIPDIRTRGANTPIQKASVEAGIRTLLLVPLRKDGVLLGYITANRREVRPFTDKQIALLESFAAQAVIAMENARLITETREALEQQTATAEVLGVINSSPGDLAPVFEAMLEKAHSLCAISHGGLLLYDGENFRAVATRGYSERFAEQVRQGFRGFDNPCTQPLIDGARFVHIPDVAEVDHPIPRAAAEIGGVHTALFVSLRKDDALLGMIAAARHEVRLFSDKEIALLQNFAAQAVIAMENARLLGELRQRTEEVAELNRGLETRVAEQVDELGRVGRLKRFLAPQLAELIVSRGDENILESHRREIVVVFCDLRGYTAFTETAEPEEVLNFLREYHGALGPLIAQFEGTLDQFSGDGIMVFFNDPVPCPDPAERAVKMAMAMREAAGELIATWRRRGRALGFGAGIAQGYATLGQIGFAERSGYTAIGTVCNLAARLCGEAKDGQILVDQRVAIEVEKMTTLEEIGALTLKGLTQPVVAFNVVRGTSPVEARPNLTVVARNPRV
jgi:GAF domain-containing protein